MKRYNDLFDKVIEINNIKLAIYQASLRKRNRKSVQKVLTNIDYYAYEIRDMLRYHKYRPSPCKISIIHDGASGKERKIYKPKFYPDQIIHWALMNVIGDILSKRFYYYSCASIKNKGTDLAFKRVKEAMQSNERYCLKLDVRKFYPSVDRKILKEKFRRVFKEYELLYLINTIIDGNITQGDGLPIGNYCSQWFANFYLTDLDNYIKNELKVKYYVRYMDDMVIFSNNKRELKRIKEKIEQYLNKEHLQLKSNWQLFDKRKRFLDFLGYRFYTNGITLRRNNFLRIKRRIKKIYKKNYISSKDASAVISYWGLLKRSNCYTFLNKYVCPYISIKRCRKVIRNENRKQHQTN